jgi:hypothetical protein
MTRGLLALGAWLAAGPALAQPLTVGDFGRGAPGTLPFGWAEQPLGDRPPSAYTLVRDGEDVVVQATADASASGLKRTLRLDPADRPTLAWRWKIDGVVPGGRIDRKEGDDYAARLYVTFDYDPAELSFADRVKYRALRALGYDVPLRALCYVWANRAGERQMAPNPYTEWVRMVPVASGTDGAGEWRSHERDLLADYRAAFGEAPPAITGFVLMTDTDDTGTQAQARFGDLVLRR